MPVADQQDQNLLRGSLQRTTTENRRFKKNIDNANVRVVAEAKLTDRKKVQIHPKQCTLCCRLLSMALLYQRCSLLSTVAEKANETTSYN